MKKRRQFFLMIFALLCIVVLFPQTASARQRPLTELWYFNWANRMSTSDVNTFMMRYGENTTIEPIEGIANQDEIRVEGDNSLSSVLIRNVGVYKDKDVNVKITLARSKGNSDNGAISLNKANFLKTTVSGELAITYDFFDSENQPIPVETTFNYYGLTTAWYIGIKNPSRIIKFMGANNPTSIVYDEYNGGGGYDWGNYWGYYQSVDPANAPANPLQSLEIMTKPVQSINMIVNAKVPGTTFDYRTDYIARPEFSRAYAVDQSYKDVNQEVHLLAKQSVPNITGWNKMSSLELKFKLNKILETKQFDIGEVKIKNFNGDDLTDLFTHELTDNGDLALTAKDTNDDRLYDTSLKYDVKLNWKKDKATVPEELISDGQLLLPFTVQTQINGNTVMETTGTNRINYMGKVTVAFLDEGDNKLRDSITKEGILTTPFDLSNDYPEIPGYEPIKDNKQDKGIFLPDEQMIIHRYREKKVLQFKLNDKENPLYISRFTNSRELSYTFSHDAGAKVYLMARCGTEEKVLKEYADAPENMVDTAKFTFPENWLDQEVFFYIKDDNNQESEKESRIIKKESSPKLIIPNTISFGENEIPAMDKIIFATTKEEFGVEDVSKLDKSHWTIKVKEEQPLTNEKGQVLAQRLSYKNQKQDVPINEDNQPIWDGSGSTKVNLAEHLQLTIHPSDTVGTYNGVLCWLLEDVPEE